MACKRATLCVAVWLVAAGCDLGDDDAIEIAEPVPVIVGTVQDGWSPGAPAAPIHLVSADGAEFAPVHAVLLPDQRVLFMGIKVGDHTARGARAGTIVPTPLGQVVPAEVTLDTHDVPVEADQVDEFPPWIIDDTPFCSGQTLLADGRVFVAGGTRAIVNPVSTLMYMYGVDYAMTYDGGSWQRLPERMKGIGEEGTPLRWYPSTTRLADGRVLVTSGRDYVAGLIDNEFFEVGTKNLSVEAFDPASGTFSMVSEHGDTPEQIFNGDYTHAFQLPYPVATDVVAFGDAGHPHILASSTGTWYPTGDYRPDTAFDAEGKPEAPNYGASTAMLPIRVANGQWGYANGAVLVAGGTHFRPHERSIDVYDPVLSLWHPRRDMEVYRHHPSTVLLPDGKVLVIAGHDDISFPPEPRIQRAQYVDPAAGFAITEGTSPMGEVRGYHTVSLLLPDGRVLIGGGRTAGPDSESNEKPSFRYYYPPYMTAARPSLVWSPAEVDYNTGFYVAGGPISEIVLVGLGAMTHSVDMNQRHVQLRIHSQPVPGLAIAIGPPDRQTAPPGHYMLFVLDANRVPSIARIVHLE